MRLGLDEGLVFKRGGQVVFALDLGQVNEDAQVVSLLVPAICVVLPDALVEFGALA